MRYLLGLFLFSSTLFQAAYAALPRFKEVDLDAPTHCEILLEGAALDGFNIFIRDEKSGVLGQIDATNIFGSRMPGVTDEALKLFGMKANGPGGVSFEIDRTDDGNIIRLLQARRTLYKFNLNSEPAIVWRQYRKGEFLEALKTGGVRLSMGAAITGVDNGYALGTVDIPGNIRAPRRYISLQKISKTEVAIVMGVDALCTQINKYLSEDFEPIFLIKDNLAYCRAAVFSGVFVIGDQAGQSR